MSRRIAALGAAVALVGAGLAVPMAAQAAEGTLPRACPTKDFWVGAGWGADRGRRQHAGIDLGGKRGTPIYAIEDGAIDRTKRQSNGALQIVMKGESGSKFYYGHMDEVLVKGGQRVTAGEVIGLMGDSGSPGAVHLHFEYWKSGGESAAVDPAPLIDRVCRLGKGGAGDSSIQADDDDVVTPKPEPEPKPEPPSDVAGEVFSN